MQKKIQNQELIKPTNLSSRSEHARFQTSLRRDKRERTKHVHQQSSGGGFILQTNVISMTYKHTDCEYDSISSLNTRL